MGSFYTLGFKKLGVKGKYNNKGKVTSTFNEHPVASLNLQNNVSILRPTTNY